MLRKSIILMVALSFALSAACSGEPTDGAPSATDNTEVNLLITDPDMAAEELALLIDFVSYRITCPDSGLTPYSDSVDLTGNFEINYSSDPPVWELVTDLPPAFCTIALWVFYGDEVVCLGSESVEIIEDGDPTTMNKVNIELVCSLSVVPPSGDVDIDADFELVNGNYCPQLFWLGWYPSPDPGVFNIQTSSTDIDGTCGQNCDPQTCDFNSNPPACTPGPDPGLSSTLSAPAGNGSFGDVSASETTYACDPLVPGPTEICVLVSDGDLDCDRTRCMTIECPDLCLAMACDDGNDCTADSCDPSTGLCINDPAPDGIACNDCENTCIAGACTGPIYTAAQNGSLMLFTGVTQTLNTTFVNPYSGESFALLGNYNVNASSYRGIGANDILGGTAGNDVLLVQDPVGTQRICGVEEIQTFQAFDFLFLADKYVVLGDMLLDGGSINDVIWANAGDDILRGNGGVDRLDGGPGNDIIEGGPAGDLITIWPGSGFDSISGGSGVDQVFVDAAQNLIQITPAANPSYEFDILYLGMPMAEVRETELVVMNDATIDLTNCTGAPTDVCSLCGNDVLNGGEECDDGNNASGDGCAADCTSEY